jgi:gluconolactonase
MCSCFARSSRPPNLCNNGGSRYAEGHSMAIAPHTDYQYGSIQRIDPKTGEAKLLYKEVDGHLLSAPNDLVFDKAGGFYFTDLGKRYARHRDHGGLYYARLEGRDAGLSDTERQRLRPDA